MFRKRGLILVTLSLVLGLSAAMVARGWVADQTNKEKANVATIVAATMAIPFGTKVEERHLKIIEMPKDSVPPGSFTLKEEVVDKVTTQPIVAGEILMKVRFVEQGEGSTLAALVDKNMRAVTVRVDDVIGVAGFLLPGNRVDVVAARREGRRAITDTILLIVRAVTLQVTPEQAEILVRGREEGSIQLTLRNPLEDEEIIEEEVVAPKPKVAVRRAPVRTRPQESTVTIIRGTNVSETKTKVSETKVSETEPTS
jgi:pilus assembly protein CpaB